MNLYDTPAQAQFINTYVPINFENLYRIAGQDLADKKEEEKSIDEAYAKWDTFVTPSTEDQKEFSDIVAKVKSKIDEISSSDGLNTREGRLKIHNIIRNVSRDNNMVNIVSNKPRFEEYLKSRDPRWGNLEVNDVSNFKSSSMGVFNGRPTAYKSIEDIVKSEYAPNEVAYKLGKTLSVSNGFIKQGWDAKAFKENIEYAKNNIAQSKEANMNADLAFSSGRVGEEFYKTITNPDKTITKIPDKKKYLDNEIDKVFKSMEWEKSDQLTQYGSHRGGSGGGSGSGSNPTIGEKTDILEEERSKQHLGYVMKRDQKVLDKIYDTKGKIKTVKVTGNPFGAEGVTYATKRLEYDNAVYNIPLINAKITLTEKQDAAGPERVAKIKELKSQLAENIALVSDKKKDELSKAKSALDEKVTATLETAKLFGFNKLSPWSKQEIIDLNKTNFDDKAINEFYNERYGSPIKIYRKKQASEDASLIKNAYTTQDFSTFSATDLSTGSPVAASATSVAGKITNYLKSPSVKQGVIVVPGGSGYMADGASWNSVVVYIPADVMDAAIGADVLKNVSKYRISTGESESAIEKGGAKNKDRIVSTKTYTDMYAVPMVNRTINNTGVAYTNANQ